MKYYALVVKTYNDGTDDKKSLYTYDTEKEAVAYANKQFGLNVGADTIAAIMCKVIDSAGSEIIKPLFWKASTLDSMKYYTLIIDTYSDGTDDDSKLYSFDSLDDAIATAHNQFGAKVELDNISTTLSIVINSVGADNVKLYWVEPTEETSEE